MSKSFANINRITQKKFEYNIYIYGAPEGPVFPYSETLLRNYFKYKVVFTILIK